MKAKVFYNETFDFFLHFLAPVQPKQFRDYVRKTKPGYKNPGSFAGICHYCKHGRFVIIGLREAGDYATLAHESLHAARAILEPRGLKLTAATQEAYAYLIEWIFSSCLKSVNEKQTTRKHKKQ